MKRTIVFFACTLLCAAGAQAQSAADLLKSKGCLGCHDFDKKKVGPAFKDVSAKYSGKKVEDAMAGMKSKPVHKGVLGKTSDSSLKTILEWVLTLK